MLSCCALKGLKHAYYVNFLLFSAINVALVTHSFVELLKFGRANFL